MPGCPIDPNNPPAMTEQFVVKQATETGEKTVFSSHDQGAAENFAKSVAGRVEKVEVPADQKLVDTFEEVTQ
jgi:hypothetical protein